MIACISFIKECRNSQAKRLDIVYTYTKNEPTAQERVNKSSAHKKERERERERIRGKNRDRKIKEWDTRNAGEEKRINAACRNKRSLRGNRSCWPFMLPTPGAHHFPLYPILLYPRRTLSLSSKLDPWRRSPSRSPIYWLLLNAK